MNKDFLLRLEIFSKSLIEFMQIFVEIYKGFGRRDARIYRALSLALGIGVFILMEWDILVFKKIQLFQLYPPDGWIFKVYAIFCMWLPILIYGALVRLDKKKFQQNLKEVFDLVGLKNSLGSYPKFLSLENLLEKTMRLRVTNGGFPKNEWESRKLRLEANMHIFIDEIEQVQERGIIEIIFSYEPMPKRISIEHMDRFQNYTFLLGRDRTREYLGDFNNNPHLLVAGETGSGKSAFMRQLITTIKYNQPEAEFHLVDLKGGVEFGMFEHFPKMKVILEASGVPQALTSISGNLKERASALKAKKLTKIEDFFESNEYKKMTIEERSNHLLGKRIFIVIDECAELFLSGSGKNAAQTKEIRAAMSSITRLGRFAGIHVILGTQRPDKQAVDPQVKSNLPVTVCFRIHDHGGSLAVLGNGKATNLPNLPGRAILQLGSQEMEIQTPFLDFKEATRILDEKYTPMVDSTIREENEEIKKEDGKPDSLL